MPVHTNLAVTVGASVVDIHGSRDEEWNQSKGAQTKWQQYEAEPSYYKPRQESNLMADMCHLLGVTNVTVVNEWMIRKLHNNNM